MQTICSVVGTKSVRRLDANVLKFLQKCGWILITQALRGSSQPDTTSLRPPAATPTDRPRLGHRTPGPSVWLPPRRYHRGVIWSVGVGRGAPAPDDARGDGRPGGRRLPLAGPFSGYDGCGTCRRTGWRAPDGALAGADGARNEPGPAQTERKQRPAGATD